MKSMRILTLALAAVAMLSVNVFADGETPDAKAEAPMELTNPQTHCPVMGGEIDSSLHTDIQGQRIYHCCPMCLNTVQDDPDAYFEKTAAKGILFENIQTNCPVSGKELKEKKVHTDYKGRRIYFCCENCVEPFTANATEFLNKMDAPADESETPAMDMEHHEMKEHGGDSQ